MKDLAVEAARRAPGQELNILREFIQTEILGALPKTGVQQGLYFVGGTALRFLHRIPRFSEDLDFSAGPGWRTKDFGKAMEVIAAELRLSGNSVALHQREDRIVQKASFRFPTILFELGLSVRREQNLSVSFEVDIHPPEGWAGQRTIVNIHRPVLIQHYDLPSMFTSKIAALLTRDYVKGRDHFDLFWYLSRWKSLTPLPVLLKNALAQKPGRAKTFDPALWKGGLRAAIKSLKWNAVERDVLPFLEHAGDIQVFTRENLLSLLNDEN